MSECRRAEIVPPQRQACMPVFLTCVIPTIGRPSLTRAVESVLHAGFSAADVEVVVVNDSGSPLAPARWQQASCVRILNTNRRERCVARNCGAAIATGTYLNFLDDDDWLLTGALDRFWELSTQHPDADWLYGGIQIVDERGACLAEMNSRLDGECFAPIMGGAWAPIQASCIRADAFFRVGGYRTDIIGTEDLDLCRRIAQYGAIASTPQPVAVLYRGADWDTSTNYLRAAEDTKRSRDAILAETDAFARYVRSADSAYWYGRMLRVYLSTVVWNMGQVRHLRAIGRLLYAGAAVLVAGRHVWTRDYWQGVRADHPPGTLHQFMASPR